MLIRGLRFKHIDDLSVGTLRIDRKLVSIEAQKYVCCKKSDAFISVDERVVHQHRFEQSSAHFDQVPVIAGPRPVECTFDEPVVPNALGATKNTDHFRMDEQDLVQGKEFDFVSGQAAHPVRGSRRWIPSGLRVLRA